MPSIHPDYEYDIFISYRQNDNQDGWVSRFVEALEKELKATLKNEVSIYFDENPHDGLLETHLVDASLAKKLKCLVFIPIISQTYCDVTSFAWEHEFMPFIKMAKEDVLGMNITLSNGNVVSRILPIKIHELDNEDHHALEAILDGPLRSIDFIYKEPGVNRPLAQDDKESKNLNKTLYKNQINKVANALKDVGVSVLKSEKIDAYDLPQGSHVEKQISAPRSKSKKKLLIPLLLIVVLALAFLLLKPLLFGEKIDKKISEVGLAIMPLKNYANNPDIDALSFAIRDEIHGELAMSKKFAFLSSTQATSSYRGKNLSPQTIGGELGVEYILTGSYQVSGNRMNIRIEFSDTETGNSVWSNKFILPYEEANKFALQADIAQRVLALFNETSDNKIGNSSSINLEAYSHYLNGLKWMEKGWEKETRLSAIKEFEQAIKLDSSHTLSWIQLIECKSLILFHDLVPGSVFLPEIEEHINKLSGNHPEWAVDLANGIYQYHALKDYEAGFKYFKKVLESYPDNEIANSLIAAFYKRKLKNSLSFRHTMKTLNSNPKSATNWADLDRNFYINGDYKRSLRSLLKAMELGLDSTYISISNFRRAGVPLDSIPKQYFSSGKRSEFSKIWASSNPRAIINHVKNIENDNSPGDGKFTKTEFYLDNALAYQALYMDDSSSYFAQLCINENAEQKEKEWWWVEQAYSILGQVEKSIEILNKRHQPNSGDLFMQVWPKQRHIRFLILSKKFEEATEMLLDFNQENPEYGDFYFLNHLVFDRAKKEYPPFAEAVANLKLPPPLVEDNQLERLKY